MDGVVRALGLVTTAEECAGTSDGRVKAVSIRRQTLTEWFTDYQLMKLSKHHHYVPGY